MRKVLFVVAVGMATSAAAQTTIGPGGVPLAPGPSQPRDFTPGGTGAGGGIAPGRAAPRTNIDREGAGGTRLAPGSAGSVGTPTQSKQTVTRPTISAKKGRIQRKIRRGRDARIK
jgi:hypothetical protein